VVEGIAPGRILLSEDAHAMHDLGFSADDARTVLDAKVTMNAPRLELRSLVETVRTVDVKLLFADVERVIAWVAAMRKEKRLNAVKRGARTGGRTEAEDLADDEGGKLVELAWAILRGYPDRVDFSITKGPDPGRDFVDPLYGRVACKGMQADTPRGLSFPMTLTFGPATTFDADIAVFGKVAHDRTAVRLSGWIERDRYKPVPKEGWERYGKNNPLGMAEADLNPMGLIKRAQSTP
jgi:hypothetical protein